MKVTAAEGTALERGFRKRWLLWALLAAWIAVGTWHTVKPMPAGTDVSTAASVVPLDEVEFLHDLTRNDPTGQAQYEQRIFDEVFRIVDEAESFVVADFFLVNDSMGAAGAPHRALSRELADKLIARKAAKPGISILFVTDPINEVYGGTRSPLLDELRAAGIDVVVTNLEQLRDSNPGYSSLWRMLVQWLGNSADGGRMLDPFSGDSAGITLRSWLALLNFKANHRKLIVADRQDGSLTALVTSANPHDASSAHSNVAIRFSGPLAEQLVASEFAVARFSGWRGHIYASTSAQDAGTAAVQAARLSFVTEAAIRDALLRALNSTRNGDAVRIATFYLSERKVIEALLEAAARGVSVRLILDPNRDAFGRQKDGVPNRPVANELVTRSGERIAVRWYRTHGEQFHTKLVLITRADLMIASLGSANLTRRNIGNYNLEANLTLEAAADSTLAVEMTSYFDRLWNNDGPPGSEYTAAFGAYRDTDRGRYWRYRLMEATGLSTF
jgi:phosphatidylserine/phosphatidylglycerophosphate/cardiolipin synthase-like enzyme